MEDREKQIEEMAKECINCIHEDVCGLWIVDENCKYYQPKPSEDSVVLSRKELERLSSSHDIVFCDNKDCPNNLLCRSIQYIQ